MEYSSLVQDVRRALPGVELRLDEPMREHCSFRVGGPAAAMAFPRSSEELAALFGVLRRAGVKPLVLGNGTNILPPDGPLDRFVVVTCPNISGIRIENDTLCAESGATLASAAMAAADAGLTGLEFAHGIPGSVGGGVVMNAGAYGGELKDVVRSTDYVDGDLVLRTVTGPEHDFAYRHSVFDHREAVILRTVFQLAPGDKQAIHARMRELDARRRASQPLDVPSAGSTFKRPVGGYASALIDQAGLRGFAVGGAQVSEKHAGFVVNTGSATAADILRLMEHIRKTVLAHSGIELEPEVLVLGR